VKLQPYLGYSALTRIKQTLTKTTQMARMIIWYPMRRHLKNRFPALKSQGLDETVSTDWKFANCRSLGHGYTGMQVFYGLTSHNINVYGGKSKSECPDLYRDFIHYEGAPSALRRDNASEEKSSTMDEIQRSIYSRDEWSEPHNQQQNPVESRAIQYLNQHVHVLLDRTGAPDSAWYLASQYLSEVHNRLADKKLPGQITPLQRRTGVTPDISAYLQFRFWQPVLYLDHEESWPSSKERAARWVGVAQNVGDHLTFWIVDDQSKQLLARSVVRPYYGNRRVKWDPQFDRDQDGHSTQCRGDTSGDF
jgi:hypothetical protein